MRRVNPRAKKGVNYTVITPRLRTAAVPSAIRALMYHQNNKIAVGCNRHSSAQYSAAGAAGRDDDKEWGKGHGMKAVCACACMHACAQEKAGYV